jgi:hypothetical protein
MRPSKIPQISREGRRRGSRRRVFVDASRCEWIAGVEERVGFRMDEADGDDPGCHHEPPPLLQVIVHRGQLLPARQGQDEMPSTSLGDRGRQTWVEIGNGVREKAERGLDQRLRCLRAACGR